MALEIVTPGVGRDDGRAGRNAALVIDETRGASGWPEIGGTNGAGIGAGAAEPTTRRLVLLEEGLARLGFSHPDAVARRLSHGRGRRHRGSCPVLLATTGTAPHQGEPDGETQP